MTQIPGLEDLTNPEGQQNNVFESGGDSESREEGSSVLTLGGERQQNNWQLEAPLIDFEDRSLLFGSLLEYPMGSRDSQVPRRSNPLREFRSRREY